MLMPYHRPFLWGPCFSLLVWAAAPMAMAQTTAGYLPAGSFDSVTVIPHAPMEGSPIAAADEAIYQSSRALNGSARWSLAAADAEFAPKSLLGNFSCAVGASLDPKALPKLSALYSRLAPDLFHAVDVAKTHYNTRRPYLTFGGEICVAKSEALSKSPNYPSGHAALGWTLGLILAELVPDRASVILARGRTFAESRAVCGVHTASAVAGGETLASGLVAALHGQAAFRADLEAARAELTLYRQTAAKPDTDCAALQTIIDTPAY